MFQIYRMNKVRLMKQINDSTGSVFLHLPDGETLDLKHDQSAVRLFQMMEIPKSGITLSVVNPKDFAGFLHMMVESKLTEDEYAC